MNTSSHRGRHRAPGRHNPLNELKTYARESAQPAMKGAAVMAATGGLVATFATPASADLVNAAPAVDAAAPVAAPIVPAAIGPSSAPQAAPALASFGFTAPAKKSAKSKPLVIEDVVVKAERAEAARVVAARAAAKAKADRAAEADRAARATRAKAAANTARAGTTQRASRSTSRTALKSRSSTTSTKSSSNSYSPRASSGTRGSRNWASAGQCTWGALAQWYASEGYYPAGWTGNALAWGSGAARAGYTVSSTPRTRSILVMQPGVHGASSYAGHVAWVTSVSGNQVTVIEMNALAGAYRYNTRTLSNIGGMRYIYAP